MQIVNGYICMNCCDVDKARLGQDPHQQANQIQKQLKELFDAPAAANAGPAVTFGGSLRSPGTADSAAAGGVSDKASAAGGAQPAPLRRVDVSA
jgi:hypothetical protein